MFSFFEKEKIENFVVIFSPKEDITTFELAKCIELIIMYGILKYSTGNNPLKGYEDTVTRHFKLEKR